MTINGDKAGNFRRLASKRVSTALKTIRTIGNLSARASYEYNSADVTKMFAAIREATNVSEAKFTRPDPQHRDIFTFD